MTNYQYALVVQEQLWDLRIPAWRQGACGLTYQNASVSVRHRVDDRVSRVAIWLLWLGGAELFDDGWIDPSQLNHLRRLRAQEIEL